MWRASVRVRISESDTRSRLLEGSSTRSGPAGKTEALSRLSNKIRAALGDPSAPTIGSVGAEWLAQHRGRATTVQTYQSTVRSALGPLLDIPVAEATPKILAEHLKTLGVGAAGTGYYVLAGLYDFAVGLGYVQNNPVTRAIKPSRPKQARLGSLGFDEVADIRRTLNAPGAAQRSVPLGPVTELLLRTGLRIGEALALQVKHVEVVGDFSGDPEGEAVMRQVWEGALPPLQASIVVTGTQTSVNGVLSRQELTKTGEKGRRRIVVSATVYTTLLQARVIGQDPEAWLFPSRNPRQMVSAANFRRAWRRQLAAYPGVTPTTYRRTVAQALVSNGEEELAQKLLGHTQLQTTLTSYAEAPIPTIDPSKQLRIWDLTQVTVE